MSVQICTCDDRLHVDEHGVLRLARDKIGLRHRIVYESNGFFRKAEFPWLARVYARVQGGGGAGGGSEVTVNATASAGGGGGGGAYVEKLIEVAGLADLELVTVGSGGMGAVDQTGTNGSFSSFGGHAIAPGGRGGGRGARNANAFMTILAIGFLGEGGDSESVGDIIVIGGSGDFGVAVGSTSKFKISGYGGATYLAGRRAGVTTNGNGLDGQDGTGQGGSGGAGEDGNDPGVTAGGNGGDGIVILELYG